MSKSTQQRKEQSTLFAPVRLGRYTLAHRLVMAPMTRNRSQRNGVPPAIAAIYYAQRAAAACIVTEATCVSSQAVGMPFMPGIYTAEQVEGWRRVVSAAHRGGARIFLQLFHAGRVSHPSLQPQRVLPVAPSAVGLDGETHTYEGRRPFVAPRALAMEEIPHIVEQFRAAAGRALDAGFDGVEVHAANGYLLDQFLRDGTNQRTDAYGGTADNRARLLLEVMQAVAAVCSPDRVGVRLSPLSSFNSMFDSRPDVTFARAVARLNELKLAYLHIVEENDVPEAGPRFDLDRLRSIWSTTYIVNGGYDQQRAEAALRQNRADLVAFGKLFLANPDLPLRFKRGSALNPPDRASFYGGDERGYVDYSFIELPSAAIREAIEIAGGGRDHTSVVNDTVANCAACAGNSKRR